LKEPGTTKGVWLIGFAYQVLDKLHSSTADWVSIISVKFFDGPRHAALQLLEVSEVLTLIRMLDQVLYFFVVAFETRRLLRRLAEPRRTHPGNPSNAIDASYKHIKV
jgi:hypothetical protein